MNRRILSTVEELHSFGIDSVAETSDDELRRLFMTLSMEYPVNAEKDPYSHEYKTAQSALYERLSGNPILQQMKNPLLTWAKRFFNRSLT